MDYTTKLAYQSNYWYNDGLNKANIRDLTGAITSLKIILRQEIFWDLFIMDEAMW